MEEIEYVYVTKSVNKDFTSARESAFKYPECGLVEAPDWMDTKECGNGLHGFLWGEGNGGYANVDGEWLLIRVNPTEGLVVFDGKCKFRRGFVVAHGDYKEIAAKIMPYLPKDRSFCVIGGTATAGDYGTATAGNYSTATAGHRGTATAGNYGAATAGNNGTATAGDHGIIIIGYCDNNSYYRRKVGIIGENKLLPNVAYKLDEKKEFMKASC